MTTPVGPDLAAVVASFGDHLHRAGLPTTPARCGRFVEAVRAARPARTTELYWLARVSFVGDRDELAAFERVFDTVFGGLGDIADVVRNPDAPPAAPADAGRPAPPAGARETPPAAGAGDRRAGAPGGAHAEPEAADGRRVVAAVESPEEHLAGVSFDACTDAELLALGRVMASLRLVAPLRRSHRTRRHPHGDRVDWRATVRAAHRNGGDPVRRVRRRRRVRRQRVVLLADVSGSMERYGRAYLYLLHGAVRAAGAEAFVFATRLTRLTRRLAGSQPAVALAAAMAAAPDWSGGTRLGAALGAFTDEWGRRGMARGAVVVIVSDGWDADAPRVEREMARLSRLTARIVWVNPRLQSPRFAPTTAAMAAALPYVDAFVSGHSLAAMDDVLDAIALPSYPPLRRAARHR